MKTSGKSDTFNILGKTIMSKDAALCFVPQTGYFANYSQIIKT